MQIFAVPITVGLGTRQSGANGDIVSRLQHTESALSTLANIANYSLQIPRREKNRTSFGDLGLTWINSGTVLPVV